MPVNFPRFQTFDYGAAMKSKQDLELGAMTNEIVGMELQEQKDLLANRKRAQEIRTQFEGMPDQIDAMEQQGMFEESAKLRDSYIQSSYDSIKMLELQREGVNGENWDQWRYDMLKSGAFTDTLLPVEYPGDDWFRDKEDEAKNKLQVQTRRWGEMGITFSQDFISDEFGTVRWEGEPYKDPKLAKGAGKTVKPWKMGASDTNSIYRAAGGLYGTMWDPETQRYQGLNKKQAAEILSISELASKIFNANEGRIPHDEAVARAARQKGIEIDKLRTPGGGENPLNLTPPPQ